MKIMIAISVIIILSTFAIVSGYLSSTSKEKREPLDAAVELREKEKIQIEGISNTQVKAKPELPDYHPEEYAEVDRGPGPVQDFPNSVLKKIIKVESSLRQRISLLDQNLGDPEARAALRAELSSPEMEAYKQAVIWKVKHENAELP
jgi:uncharacterized ion transporter superfamily protein YfcC